MKICFLTQTASDISDYYKAFFKGYDLFFVTPLVGISIRSWMNQAE